MKTTTKSIAYQHQQRIIVEDKKKAGLFTGTGSGKTLTALLLAKGKTLVISPKQQKLDKTWEKNAEKFNLVCDLTVMSKEEFRRDHHKTGRFDTVIFDEAHTVLGVHPEMRQRKGKQIPKCSQLFEACLTYLQKHPPERLYLCSATPCPKPMAMWGIATLMGNKWDFYRFREAFYFPIRMGQRQIWMPKKDEATKTRLANAVKKIGYTGSLSDFADVPEQTDKVVYVELTSEQKEAIRSLQIEEADAMVRASRERTISNGVLYGRKIEKVSDREDRMIAETIYFPSKKIDYILERAQEFPRLLIFCNYTAQIQQTQRALEEEGYKVLTLTGATIDRKGVIDEANSLDECILISQSSISSGWELPEYPCVIFASLSWRVVDHVQARGRVLRMNALKKNLYIYIVTKGTADERCFNSIMDGNDFLEKMNTNEVCS